METLGVVETWNISSGVRLMDVMLKAADVTLVKGIPICSGRYMIHIAGNRAAVETSVGAGTETGTGVAASFVISGISSQVLKALKQQSALPAGCAVGVVEGKKAVACIAAADAAVKRAAVIIGRMTIANGINGKSYLVLGGSVTSVEEAVAAAKQILGRELVDAVVLSRPDDQVIEALVPISNQNLSL